MDKCLYTDDAHYQLTSFVVSHDGGKWKATIVRHGKWYERNTKIEAAGEMVGSVPSLQGMCYSARKWVDEDRVRTTITRGWKVFTINIEENQNV